MPLNIVLLKTGRIGTLPKLCRLIMCLLDGSISPNSPVYLMYYISYQHDIDKYNGLV